MTNIDAISQITAPNISLIRSKPDSTILLKEIAKSPDQQYIQLQQLPTNDSLNLQCKDATGSAVLQVGTDQTVQRRNKQPTFHYKNI